MAERALRTHTDTLPRRQPHTLAASVQTMDVVQINIGLITPFNGGGRLSALRLPQDSNTDYTASNYRRRPIDSCQTTPSVIESVPASHRDSD